MRRAIPHCSLRISFRAASRVQRADPVPSPVLLALLLVAAFGLAAWLVVRRHSLPRWRGPRSDHFDGRRFVNQATIPDKSLRDVLRWQLGGTREAWPEWIDGEPGPPPPARVADGALRVTWVNHATVLVQMDGRNVLVDPVWSERVSPVSWAGPKRHRAPGLRFEDLPPIDVVVVSHAHYDHLDVATLRRLAREHRPVFVVGLGNAEYLRRFGVVLADARASAPVDATGGADGERPPSGRLVELDWDDALALGDGMRLVALPAQHWSSRTPWDRARTLWCAFVLEGPAGRVYLAGDTGYGAHLADAGHRFGPFRLAVLPIGAFLPRWFMRDNHMSPGDAVRAAADLRAAESIVVHFGTFALGDDGPTTPVDALRAALAGAGDDAPSVRVVAHGMGYAVPPLPPSGSR